MKEPKPVDYNIPDSAHWTPAKEMDTQGNIVDKKTSKPKYDANGLPVRVKKNGTIR